MVTLSKYEMDIIRTCNGEDMPGIRWGAAMGEAIESLRHDGYLVVTKENGGIRYIPTQKGLAAIKGD